MSLGCTARSCSMSSNPDQPHQKRHYTTRPRVRLVQMTRRNPFYPDNTTGVILKMERKKYIEGRFESYKCAIYYKGPLLSGLNNWDCHMFGSLNTSLANVVLLHWKVTYTSRRWRKTFYVKYNGVTDNLLLEILLGMSENIREVFGPS